VIVAPGDSTLWVAKQDSVYAIDLKINVIIARFQIGGFGNGMAIARDTLLYVSNQLGKVIEFNLRTRSMARTFAVADATQKLTVSQDGLVLYIAGAAPSGTGLIEFWDLQAGRVLAFVTLPAAAYGIARRPSNGLLYATSASGPGYLYVVDPATRSLISSTIIGGSPREVVFSEDGTIGIIPNGRGWVDFIR
jgi:DNA-binding beta-propeller fold protein YncE